MIMEERPRQRQRKALLFLLVCAMHGALGWLLLATNGVMRYNTPAGSLELLVLPPAQVPLPESPPVKQQFVAPRNLYQPNRRSPVDQGRVAESNPESNEITPSIDWNAELARAARAAASGDTKVPPRNFGFPTGPPTTKDYPQFDWDYARTHRVETLPEGGMVIHLNDNCIIVLTPFPFPLCSPFKRKANGELFKHMHDPDKPADAGLP
jgi:hypothetical protein